MFKSQDTVYMTATLEYSIRYVNHVIHSTVNAKLNNSDNWKWMEAQVVGFFQVGTESVFITEPEIHIHSLSYY